ncbi:DUF2690 domain-containing protein [Streptomyces sp. G44]|uniref:DUF2690 domain-containing protein n=1 Tax=Streptomyces sp. G44 TaxID=2807632 RepID=UPI00195F6DA1|nr:DUF2690 domain-containing protein [Streptomyces sp. G44]MBM7170385.1 DUF2690 domain-containing protein [Streptomyces sp. G44]
MANAGDDGAPAPPQRAPWHQRARHWVRARSGALWRRLSGRTEHPLLIAVVAALIGLVGTVGAATAPLWWPASDPPKCPGAGCEGKDPIKEGCVADAVTWSPRKDNPAALELRYSRHCGTVWGRIRLGYPSDQISVQVDGGSARSALIDFGRDRYTQMATVTKHFRARVCAEPNSPRSLKGWKKYCIDVTDDMPWKA